MSDLLRTALQVLEGLEIFPSRNTYQDWLSVPPAIRQKSFFSSRVASADVLNRLREFMLDWMGEATEQVENPTTGEIETVYKVQGPSDFVVKMQEFMVSEGLAEPDETSLDVQELRNIAANNRLKLIFNTNIQQANQFATYQRDVRHPRLRNRFPAARFVRSPGAREPRPLHVANEEVVKRKDDYDFWLRMNSAEIGGFEVPWGPWGFNSYMMTEDVRRREAERLGLVKKGEEIPEPDLSRWGGTMGQQYKGEYSSKLDENGSPRINRQLVAEVNPVANVNRDGELELR